MLNKLIVWVINRNPLLQVRIASECKLVASYSVVNYLRDEAIKSAAKQAIQTGLTREQSLSDQLDFHSQPKNQNRQALDSVILSGAHAWRPGVEHDRATRKPPAGHNDARIGLVYGALDDLRPGWRDRGQGNNFQRALGRSALYRRNLMRASAASAARKKHRWYSEIVMAKHYVNHSLQDANLCRELRLAGLSYQTIADKMDIPRSSVWGICNGTGDQGRDGVEDVVQPLPRKQINACKRIYD